LGNFEKFLAKLLQKPVRTDITFQEMYNFLTCSKIGFDAHDNGGSHCKFRKGGELLTIPRKDIKPYLIRQVIEKLENMGLI